MAHKAIAKWKTKAGYKAVMVVDEMGFIKGYVGVTEYHPAFCMGHSMEYVDIDFIALLRDEMMEVQSAINHIAVHGGLTSSERGYGEEFDKDRWWFGFKACYFGDAPNFDFAKKELWDIMDEHEKAELEREAESYEPNKWKTWKSPDYIRNECEELARQLRCIEEIYSFDE